MAVVRNFLQQWKKQLFYIAAGFLALLAIWYGFLLYTTGKITINTNNQSAKISVYRQRTGAVAELVSSHTGDFTERLQPGAYIIQATEDKNTSSQNIAVTARETQDITLNVQTANDTQIIASTSAQSLASNGQALLYLDTDDTKLKRVTSSNRIETVSEAITFKRFEWLSLDYGAGLSTDGQIYTYTNAGIPRLISSQQPTAINRFGLAPDKTLYVSGGTNIYRYTGTSFTPIETAITEARLTPSIDGVLASSSLSTSGTSQDATYIKTDGKKITTSLPNHKDASWSIDGKILALATQSQVLLYDSNLEPIGTLPIKDSVVALTWKDANTLLYGSTNKIWAYNAKTRTSGVITEVQDSTIKTLWCSGTDNVIYFAIDKSLASGGNQQIAKTELGKFFTPNNVQELQKKLPVSTAEYNIDFINLTYPTIYISPAEFSDPQYKETAKDSIGHIDNIKIIE